MAQLRHSVVVGRIAWVLVVFSFSIGWRIHVRCNYLWDVYCTVCCSEYVAVGVDSVEISQVACRYVSFGKNGDLRQQYYVSFHHH